VFGVAGKLGKNPIHLCKKRIKRIKSSPYNPNSKQPKFVFKEF
jgi:hypothetical protein